MINLLMLGAGGPAASNVLDALRLSGRPYRAIGADCSPVHLHLSVADERIIVPRAGADGYTDALAAACRTFAIDLVHPQPDPDVRELGRIRDQIPSRTFLPSQPALETAGEKAAFSAAMERAGVAVPVSRGFDGRESVFSVTAELLESFPRLWIRARVGAASRGALPVSTPDQALGWVDWWVAERGLAASDFMAAEFLPGREFAYESVWRDGQLVGGQARERIEYFYGHVTPSGQTSTAGVARTVSEGRVDRLAQQAIEALDPKPQGIYHVDLKEDAEGRLKVTEVNAGRFPTTCNFFANAGLNLPDIYVQTALGETVAPQGSSPLPADLYWIRMVDMGFRLVPGEVLDAWPRPNP